MISKMSVLRCMIFVFLVVFHQAQSQCVKSPTRVSGSFAPTGNICSGDLIFEENFDDLNLKKWQHEITLGGGGNWEFQYYLNSRWNSYAEDGKLKIVPTLLADETGEDYLYSGTLDINGGSPGDACTNPQFYGCLRVGTANNILNPIKSARLRTVDSFSFAYGKIDVRAKLPAGDWLWPAIWMLPRDDQYSNWPVSGEIDIMESRGNRKMVSPSGQNLGPQLVGHTLHWGPNYANNKYMMTHYETENPAGYDGDFHRYQMEWTPDGITFGVDNVALPTIAPPDGGFWELGGLNSTGLANPWRFNSKMAPFDQEFYILINLAVGGTTYFPDDAINPGGKPWSNKSPRASSDFWEGRDQWLPGWQLGTDTPMFQIDYVKVWAL